MTAAPAIASRRVGFERLAFLGAWVATLAAGMSAQEAPLRLGLQVHQGREHVELTGEVVLIRGSPLAVGVSLEDATAQSVRDAYLARVREEQARAASEGRARDFSGIAPPPRPDIMLPSATGKWPSWLRMELVRVDPATGASLGVALESSVFAQAIEAAMRHRPVHDRMTGAAVSLSVFVPPDVVAQLPDGQYMLNAQYDTTHNVETEIWHGTITASRAPLVLRDPADASELLSRELHLVGYFRSMASFTDMAAHAQAILDLDASYRDFEAYAALGDARAGMGDMAAARTAWSAFLANCSASRDDVVVIHARRRLGETEATDAAGTSPNR